MFQKYRLGYESAKNLYNEETLTICKHLLLPSALEPVLSHTLAG